MLKIRFIFVISLFFALTSAVSYAEETSGVSAVSGIASTNFVETQVETRLEKPSNAGVVIKTENGVEARQVQREDTTGIVGYIPAGSQDSTTTARIWVE
ncbi:MAG: hypothetical protein IKW67_00445 [Alphaproteobacteria bacterium]|nr:hypothetical protein [Alphaproteobacteria bacterium]